MRRAIDEDTKIEVAIKEIEKEKIKQVDLADSLKKEISLLRMVDHPNIVKLIEVLASKSKIYVVLEYIRGGDLFDKIRSPPPHSRTLRTNTRRSSQGLLRTNYQRVGALQ